MPCLSWSWWWTNSKINQCGEWSVYWYCLCTLCASRTLLNYRLLKHKDVHTTAWESNEQYDKWIIIAAGITFTVLLKKYSNEIAWCVNRAGLTVETCTKCTCSYNSATDCVTGWRSEKMPGFPCSQLQQTLSHSQGQGKCLAALVHRWNVRLSNSEVRENVWVHLSVRSGEMPGCTCPQLQQTVSYIEVRENAWVHLCPVATDCVTHWGQGKCLGALLHSCKTVSLIKVRGNVWVHLYTVARLSHIEVRGNAWVNLCKVATDCVTQWDQGKCLGAPVQSCNRLCHTVRSGEMPGLSLIHISEPTRPP